jgi:hypothetical protein
MVSQMERTANHNSILHNIVNNSHITYFGLNKSHHEGPLKKKKERKEKEEEEKNFNQQTVKHN